MLKILYLLNLSIFMMEIAYSSPSPFILEMDKCRGIAGLAGKMLLPAQYDYIYPLGKNQFWISSKVSAECSAALFDASSQEKLTDFAFSLQTGPMLITPPWFSDYDALDAYVNRNGKLLPALVFRDGTYLVRGHGVWESSGGGAFVPARLTDDKVGLFDVKKRKFIPNVIHDEISLPNHGISIVKDNTKKGMINCLGQEILPSKYEDIVNVSFFTGSSAVMCEGRQGLFSACGEWLLPLQTDTAFFECNPELPYVRIVKNGKEQLYDTEKCKLVSNRIFDKIVSVTRRCFIAIIDDSWILSTCNGEEIMDSKNKIEFSSDYGNDGPCIVRSASSEHFIVNGKTLTSLGNVQEVAALPYQAPLFLVCKKESQKGVLSLDGKKMIIPFENCRRISAWGRKIKKTSSDGIVNLLSIDGDILLCDKRISMLDNLDSSGHARIVCDGKAGLVDGECNFVLPCQYEDVGHFGDGLVPAKTGGKWGFVSLDGEWIIPARFEEARSFRDGYAPVRMGGRWGFIDKSGKAATPIDYEDVKDVREGHFRAKVNGKWGIFALDGTCTLPAEYDNILSDDEYGYGDP